jgi:hypothetical protein
MEREPERPASSAYYVAIVLFVAVLAFAVLGLVRSTSRAGAATGRLATPQITATPSYGSAIPLSAGRVPSPQIPPPPPSAPTQPPSRTFLYPAPGLQTPPPEAGPQTRR